jgi:hypothetical protein
VSSCSRAAVRIDSAKARMRGPAKCGPSSVLSRRCASPRSWKIEPGPISGSIVALAQGAKHCGSAAKMAWMFSGRPVQTTRPLSEGTV